MAARNRPKPAQTVELAPAKGGRGLCAACGHPERDAIDRDLVGRVPGREIAARWGISRTSLRRHMAGHVSPGLVAVSHSGTPPVSGVDDPALDQLRELAAAAKAFLRVATEAGNSHQGLGALREARQTLELIAKITGELDVRPTVVINVQTTTAWIAVREVVFEIFAPYPELRAEFERRLKELEDEP